MTKRPRCEDTEEDADICHRFSLRLLGCGSFGRVYECTDLLTGEQVAVKIANPDRIKHLSREYKAYVKATAVVGIPRIKAFNGHFLVMERLGASLHSLFVDCNRKFSLKTVLQLADQMLSRLEQLHQCGIIHRDIKPSNFVMGRGNQSRSVYLIDFGLAKSYRFAEEHISYRTDVNRVGTVRYSSLNCHLRVEQTCRDDLEALAYVLIHLLGKQLPWCSITKRGTITEERNDRIRNCKATANPRTICRELPHEFATFLAYSRRLGYAEPPDYDYLRQLFRDLARRRDIQYDGIFDWDLGSEPKTRRCSIW